MKIVIAPQAYKGCLNSKSVALNIEMGIREANPKLETDCFHLADGGEGTLDLSLIHI